MIHNGNAAPMRSTSTTATIESARSSYAAAMQRRCDRALRAIPSMALERLADGAMASGDYRRACVLAAELDRRREWALRAVRGGDQ